MKLKISCDEKATEDEIRWCYYNYRSEIRFVRGRLKFGGMQNSAPFTSMIVIFRSPR